MDIHRDNVNNEANQQEIELNEVKSKSTIFLYSGDRNIENERTFNYNVNFGNAGTYGSSITKVFRNISSIEIENVVIPDFYINLRDIHAYTDTNLIQLNNNENIYKSHIPKLKRISDLPYLLLRFREFSQTNYGTNNYITEAFSLLLNDTERYKSNNNNYAYDVSTGASQTLVKKDNFGRRLIPSERDKICNFVNISSNKTFYPSLKGVLNTIELSFMSPNGNEITLMNDYLSLSECYYYKNSANVSTTEDLNATYSSGVGTLTCNSNGSISIDTVALSLNETILVKDQTTLLENGYYKVTTVGDGSNPFVLTRETLNINDVFIVSEGSTNINKIFRYIQSSNIVFREENAIKLKTTRFFSPEEYKIGNTIKLSSLVSNTNENRELNKYLLRQENHYIIDLFDDSNSSNTMFNSIVIGLHSNLNNNDGTYSHDSFSMANNVSTFTKGIIISDDNQHLIQVNIEYNRYIEKFKSKLL